MINKLAQEIYQNAKDKGFYEDEPSIAERLALIHSEVSEALEADRKDQYCDIRSLSTRGPKPSINVCIDIKGDDSYKYFFEKKIKGTFEDEIADVIIRCLDLAAHLDIDIENHIKAKHRYNTLRPHKHGKKY